MTCTKKSGSRLACLLTGAVLAFVAPPLLADTASNFGVLDKDGDERISRSELTSFPRLSLRFDAADKDGNGALDTEEFRKLVSQPGVQALPE